MKYKSILFIIFLNIISSSPGYSSPQSVIIKDIPHVHQLPDFCGEACVEMVLKKLGHNGDQNWVFNQSGLPPMLGRGCYTKDLYKALKKIGFKTGTVWRYVDAENSKAELKAIWDLVYNDLKKDIPSIVCMNTSNSSASTEHMRLVTGYDAEYKEVIYHEPGEKRGAESRIKLEKFLNLWPLKYNEKSWTVIRFKMLPGILKKYIPESDFSNADYTQHYMQLKKRVPGSSFSVVLKKPFFVIGNQKRSYLEKRWANGTIEWAVAKLKALYFNKNPNKILDIWLFKDKAGYRKYTKQIWNTEPGTPYGYYSRANGALVMNIATGGGTLIHEIVHPFIESNFPECPDWLNEGLGSLYEQSGERSGKIVGLTNWRLTGLQSAIMDRSLPSFKKLTKLNGFYDQQYGYAQARYLCYYLQNHGLLVKFYKSFKANVKKDPTGYNTLKKILKVSDMAAFKKKWQAWVLKLNYPPST